MDLVAEHNLLSLLVSNISQYHSFYQLNTKIQASKALAGRAASQYGVQGSVVA